MEIPACCTCGIRTRPGHTILDEEGEDQVVARPICGACVVKLVADVERVGMALRVQEVDPAGGRYPLASRSSAVYGASAQALHVAYGDTVAGSVIGDRVGYGPAEVTGAARVVARTGAADQQGHHES